MLRILFALLTAAPVLYGQFTFGGEVRGRGEEFTALDFAPGVDNAYYLSRVRLHAGWTPFSWLHFFGEAQDSRAPGYRTQPAPATVADYLDLRQAYVEFGNAEKGWALRAGRQELIFGDERLVGASNWSNVGRSFDAARLSYKRGRVRLDWFASAVVVAVRDDFNEPHFNNKLYGVYATLGRWEPYWLLKTNATAKGERGETGDLDVHTWGLRSAGPLPHAFDYSIEMALQAGHAAKDTMRAGAGHWAAGFRPSKHVLAPRIVGEYNYASGDQGLRDGRRGTFDQLYPTNHNKYGTADRIGWRNIHDAMGGLEWKPDKRWKINLDYHSFWLATRKDALYTESGGVLVRNPNATSSHIGNEADLQVAFRQSAHLSLGAGYGHLFAGEYLKQSTGGSPASTFYGMWTVTF